MSATAVPAGTFAQRLMRHEQFPLRAEDVTTLQVNVGLRCNLACRHCHLEAGPQRAELMSERVLDRCVAIARQHPSISTIDITGGAPEMNPGLAGFIRALAPLGRRLIVRSNLAILTEPEYSHLLDVYTEHGVEIVGSLPDHRAERADRQRGAGVFSRAVETLRRLNARGYGDGRSGLALNLVHNPLGAYLVGSQAALEAEFRSKLAEQYGLAFDSLFTLVNMPLGRFQRFLATSGNEAEYAQALDRSFNAATVPQVMCRFLVSVRWDGRLFDCDFNQALDLPLVDGSVRDVDTWDTERLRRREIAIGDHCFGCTAGAGSSCQGSLTS